MSEHELLMELREPIEGLVHRHLDNAREWYPHETTPWSEARNFTDADPYRPEDHELSPGVRSALYVNLLTEDNLPYYTETILGHAPKNHPLNEWTRRWTAEEARHSVAIRDWIIATRAFDPRILEDGRMAQMSGGEVPQPDSLAELLAYTSFQELATNVAHRNTGRRLGKERGGAQVMGHVAGDEQLHYKFYSDAAKAAIEVDPSTMIIAIAKQLRSFSMPGTGIPRFIDHAEAIAREGIYDIKQFKESVVEPTLRHWDLESVDGLTAEAEKAREKIFRQVRLLGRAVSVMANRQETAPA